MRLIQDNVALVRQGIALLESLDDELFVARPPGLPAGGVGPQFRHVLDYYRCFVRDVARGRVDYDLRERDPEVETERRVAIARLGSLVRDLAALGLDDDTVALHVKADVDPAAPPDETWSPSSVRRELMFLASHTVHHYALIAVTLGAHGVQVAPEFGVAPSTLRHWARTGLGG
ncbi:MAG: hypothetical protein H6825_09530 [Planctomycetes bacterium]|nr:hypothetical protein [Planctomycetota bacterium]